MPWDIPFHGLHNCGYPGWSSGEASEQKVRSMCDVAEKVLSGYTRVQLHAAAMAEAHTWVKRTGGGAPEGYKALLTHIQRSAVFQTVVFSPSNLEKYI